MVITGTNYTGQKTAKNNTNLWLCFQKSAKIIVISIYWCESFRIYRLDMQKIKETLLASH